MNADEQMRANCLSEAIRACGMDTTPDDIVAAAQKFEAFVTGKKAKKRAR